MAQKSLTLNEAADYLHISRSFLYKLNQSGAIKSYKIGRIYRFMVSDLDKFINENVKPSNPNHYGK